MPNHNTNNRRWCRCRRLLFWLTLLLAMPCYAVQIKLHTEINGISGLPLDNALLRLQVVQREVGQVASPKEQYSFYTQIPDLIRIALKPYGYFEPEITKTLIKKGVHWFAYYNVKPGPQVKIIRSNLSIEGKGAPYPFFQAIQNKFPIRVNDPLNTQLYLNTKNVLVQTAINHGFLTSHFNDSTIEINIKSHQAQVNIDFDTGPQYNFGKTFFSRSPLKNEFLSRYIKYEKGSPFNNSMLQKLQDDLGDTHYFDQVIVSPQLPSKRKENTSIPIFVQLTPKKKQIYKVSIGYGTNNGVRSSAQLDLPFVNERGHRAQIGLTVAKKLAVSDLNRDEITVDTDYPTEATLKLNYIVPGGNPTKEMFVGETIIQRSSFHLDTGRRPYTNQNITGKYIRQYGWKQVLSLSYLHENSEDDERNLLRFDLLSPAVEWIKRHSDDILFPSKGSVFSIKIRNVNNLVNSDYDFMVGMIKAKKLCTFLSDNRLVFHSELGYMSHEDQHNVPRSYQLRTGGTNSLRGFDYLAIGPGTHMAIAGLEYQRVLEDNWIAGTFIEGGNVYRSMSALKHPKNIQDKTKVSHGLSLTKQTPIGAFTLSFAKAKHWISPERRWQWKTKWHFSIGTEL